MVLAEPSIMYIYVIASLNETWLYYDYVSHQHC